MLPTKKVYPGQLVRLTNWDGEYQAAIVTSVDNSNSHFNALILPSHWHSRIKVEIKKTKANFFERDGTDYVHLMIPLGEAGAEMAYCLNSSEELTLLDLPEPQFENVA